MPDPERTPKSNILICAKCSLVVHSDSAPAFKCSLCARRIHVSCAPAKYTDNEIRKLSSGTSPFLFLCFLCADKVAKGRMKQALNEVGDLQNTHALEMQKLRGTYEARVLQMLERQTTMEQQIQTFSRDAALNKLGEASKSKKRRKPDELVEQEDSFLGFQNKESMITSIKEAFAPFFNRMEDLSKRQDTLTNSINDIQSKLTNINQIANQSTKNDNIQTQQVSSAQQNQAPKKKEKSKEREKIDGMTYAQALAKAPMPVQCIKNLSIMGKPEEITHITNSLKMDNVFTDIPIKAVKSKGKANITLKCNDPASAQMVAESIKNKYGESVKDVIPTRPMIKIMKLHTDEAHAELIVDKLVQANLILKNVNFKIEQMYVTNPNNGLPFKNIIISTDINSHGKLLEKGSLIFNLSECKLYEYINLLMCSRCLKYGHFARNCVFPTCSREKCSLNHPTRDCIATSVMKNMNCTNCIAANKRGASYAIRHRSTDERCESRLERIATLKQLIVAKN